MKAWKETKMALSIGTRRPTFEFEALEPRLLLAVGFYDVGYLQFSGDFTASGTGFSALGTEELPVLVGLAPQGTANLNALLRIVGEVFIPDKDSGTEFYLGGMDADTTSMALLLDVPTPPILWQIGQAEAAFEGKKLSGHIPGGMSLTDAGEGVGFTILNIPTGFVASKIAFLNKNGPGGDTSDAVVLMQGEIDFSNLSTLPLGSLTVGVDGSGLDANFVKFHSDTKEIELTGVNANVTSPHFTAAGLKIYGTIGASYSTDTKEFGFSGGATIKTSGIKDESGGSTVAIKVGVDGPGLVIDGDGSVVQIELQFTGSIKVWDMLLQPKKLTFELSGSQFVMYGGLTLQIPNGQAGGDEGYTPIYGNFGTLSDPGLMLNVDTGEVENVNIGLSGDLNMLGFVLEIPGGNPVRFSYDGDTSTYGLSGQVTAPQLWGARVIAGSENETGIEVKDGNWQIDDVSLTFANVELGAFKIKELEVTFDQDGTTLDFGFTLFVVFPQGWEVDTIIDMDYNESNKRFEIDEVYLEWKSTNEETRIPIGDTGLFLTEMDADVKNFFHPKDIVVSGGLTVEFGEEVSFFGKTAKMFSAQGEFTVDKDELVLDGNVWMGSIGATGGKPTALLGEGTGKAVLDWNAQQYSLDSTISLYHGVFEVDMKFEFDKGGEVIIQADAKVKVPHGVPLIGGKTIGKADFLFMYASPKVTGGQAEGFVAAWTKVNLLVTKVEAGFIDLRFAKGTNHVLPK